MYAPLCDNEVLCDSTLHLSHQGDEYHGHPICRVILAGHSSYFLDMFTSSIESRSKAGRREYIVDVEPKDAPYLSDLIRFMYTGTLTTLDRTPSQPSSSLLLLS
eukprot:TRINITY_DN13626_c0_g2_i2.p1 TRINITY_DN13626_c0_g2~~TRINITY_DN13626_c0_g2_i2.p1  ORF type:complete len:104 (+),score=2.10 TRINITY_DN13626_c0_g2_i2:88-399(+)